MRRLLAAALAAAAFTGLAAVAGCGGGTASYDMPYSFGPAGECYYDFTPAEVPLLIAEHHCAPGSVAVQAPVTWMETYWDYYDSTAYYDVYVPARYRSSYVKSESLFGRHNRVAIRTLSSKAVYRSSSGAVVHGYKTGTVRFGSGTSFGSSGQRYSSGNLRKASKPATTSYKPSGTNLRKSSYHVGRH